ncbi:MAG: oxidoreductase, partial [Chloroflexi bacterium]|nr:oxidoreductase [Chloroflexota bacterium]
MLILGLSNICRRRVLPALLGLTDVESVDVATHKALNGGGVEWDAGKVYDDYATALGHSDASVVYVSLVNSMHLEWARAAIERGLHVVVDKPAFLGLNETEQMLNLADRHGVCLAEATVFGYHPQAQLVKDELATAGCAATRISATLSFPPMDPANFRYRRALGGGCLWDLGPYASAVGRVFFGGEPQSVACTVLAYGGADDVDVAFNMLADYSDGRSVVGHYGFDTVYRNRLDLLASDVGLEVDRFFTTLPDDASDVRITTRQGTQATKGPTGDAFGAFFSHVFNCID